MTSGFFYSGTTDIDTIYNKASKNTSSTTNFLYKKADGTYVDIGMVYTLLSDYPASDWNRTVGDNCNFLSGTTDIGGTFIKGGVTINEPYATGVFTKKSIPLNNGKSGTLFTFTEDGSMVIPNNGKHYLCTVLAVGGGGAGQNLHGGNGGSVYLWKSYTFLSRTYTITIGTGETAAFYRLNNTIEVVPATATTIKYDNYFTLTANGATSSNTTFTQKNSSDNPTTTLYYPGNYSELLYGGGAGAGGNGYNGGYLYTSGMGGAGYTYTIFNSSPNVSFTYGGGGGGQIPFFDRYLTQTLGSNGGGKGEYTGRSIYATHGAANTGGGGGGGFHSVFDDNTIFYSSGGSGVLLFYISPQ